MMPKYIEDDIVKYNDKIMVIKEPRDGSHFDLFCPQEVYKSIMNSINKEV